MWYSIFSSSNIRPRPIWPVYLDPIGKKHHLKIYTVYRPCQQNDNSTGDQTVWQQHRRALRNNNITTDPRQQILNSLALHIRADIAKKRQVIVLGDFNSSIFDPELNKKISKLGLHNAVEQYMEENVPAR